MKVELEIELPENMEQTGNDGDSQSQLGSKLAQLFSEIGLPVGAMIFVEIKSVD